jgi:poly(A) polymerase
MLWVMERMAPTETTAADNWRGATATQAVMAALGAGDGQARFVGGCVRNTVMELPVTDIDIATVHAPEETIRRLESAGIAAKPTGLSHGTITAFLEECSFEITTLRRDVETDGRHAVVAFTDKWSEDAARRDFTMNALFMDVKGVILDPMNGRQDALDGKVRFVGDPGRRIREDALRILRFFRFQAQYGRQPLDPDGLDACRRDAESQTKLSGERIQAELMKLLQAKGAVQVIRSMAEANILFSLFQRDLDVMALERLVSLEASTGIDQPGGLRRLATIFDPIDDAIIDRLRFSNVDRARLQAMSTDSVDPSATDSDLKVWCYKLGEARFVDALLLTAAREHAGLDKVHGALNIVRTWNASTFPLRGADLIKLGLVPGAQVGRILAKIEEDWIADGMRGDHDTCLAWARLEIEQDRNPS